MRPPRHHGTDSLDNLAWACPQCNNNKGTDIASYDVLTQQRVWLYNPRFDKWVEHFSLDTTGYIIGKTPEGRATVHLLNINELRQVEFQAALMAAGLW